MYKLWKRFLAYLIDMMVVLLITQCLAGLPFLNRQLSDYTKYYTLYTELVKNYTEFQQDLKSDYKDKELSFTEYEDLSREYPSYQEQLEKYYDNQILTEKNYNQLIDEIEEEYRQEYQELYYMIEKNSVVQFIIYLVVMLGYFVFFNKITDGQTLGKKLMKLKIVCQKKDSGEVSLWSYLIRTLILYQPIYYLSRLMGIFFLGKSNYYSVISIVYDIQYYLEFLSIIMILVRVDGRGLHDLLAKTRVMMYDYQGNEIMDSTNGLKQIRLKSKRDS